MEFHGEYGIEICTFIPYINYLLNSGGEGEMNITTYEGMQPYYFFMDPAKIKYKKERRNWVPSPARSLMPDHLKDEDEFFKSNSSCSDQYLVPDYYTYYKQFKVETPKPILIIQNKYNMEWGGPPINYIKTETLEKTLPYLCKNFKVIYIRSNDVKLPGYSSDMNEMYEFQLDDKDMIRSKFPEVTLFEDMLSDFPQYDFNTLKCILFASADTIVTVLGGAHFFAVCFPCKQIIHRCDKPESFPDVIYKHPYNLNPHVTTPEKYDRQWFQNSHDVLCFHSHSQLKLTRSHLQLDEELLSL